LAYSFDFNNNIQPYFDQGYMDNEKIILLTVFAGSVFTLALILSIIAFVVIYQRKMVEQKNMYQLSIKSKEVELLQSVIITQESERQKIAMNLHDGINPLLSGLKLAITRRERNLKAMGLEIDGMNQEKKLIDEIVENIGIVTRDLSPQVLYRYGLSSAICSFVNNISEVKVTFNETNFNKIELNNQIALNVYRIALELIQNILKHEKCSRIDVTLNCSEKLLIIEINHDGKGISNQDFVQLSEVSTGIGLNSLKSRTVLLNAILDYQNEQESKISLTVPLTDEKEN
jgi:two-component system NarL family sensor kinase